MMTEPGASSGKVILLGEHAVVHGVVALAASIGRGAWARARPAGTPRLAIRNQQGPWSIEPNSELARAYRILCETVGIVADADATIEIPTRAGLGSSACLGVALARALLALRGSPYEIRDVIAAATAWETVFHGNPSGIDVAVAAHGGCIAFSRAGGVTPIDLRSPIPLCIGDTGLRSSTRAMVDHVTAELGQQPDGGRSALEAIERCVLRARTALALADWPAMGTAMHDNHARLRALGLSNPPTEQLCDTALRAGALGAKITGAGGGGCVIALAPERQQFVLDAWRSDGFDGFAVEAGL